MIQAARRALNALHGQILSVVVSGARRALMRPSGGGVNGLGGSSYRYLWSPFVCN